MYWMPFSATRWQGRAVGGWLGILSAASALLATCHTVTCGQSIRAVALSGQIAPVSSGDVRFLRFDVPAIDGQGRTAFLADLAGDGARGDHDGGVFSEAQGSLNVIARHGDQSVGLADGVVLDRFSLFNYSATGNTAFHATLMGAGVTDDSDTSLWAETSDDGLTLLARAGDALPGVDFGAEYAAFFTRPAINDKGQVVFFPELRESPTGILTSGLMAPAASGGLTLVAKAGDRAPGTDGNTVFLEQGFENPFSSRTVSDSAGGMILLGFVDGANVTEATNAGLWVRGDDGDLQLLVRNGDHAPGTSPVMDFLSFAQLPRINAAGDVAFAAFLTRQDNSDELFNVGIWRGGVDELELVAQTNSPAPLHEPDIRFGDLSLPNINDRGDVSFQAVLSGDTVQSVSELSLWSKPFGANEALRLVARAGDHAPGTAPDVEFRAFSTHVLNASGHLAFMAVVGGPDISAADGNVNGIWAEDVAGNLVLIARDGDLLEVAPGDVRTIQSLAFQANTGNSDGQPSGFNDDGMIAFRARFADGSSGIFVSSVASIPEPRLGFWTMMLIGYAAGHCLRKR